MTLQRKSNCLRGVLMLVASMFMCSCITQGVPSHGGGKRFFYEQALITKAVDNAVGQLDLDPVASGTNRPIEVYVIAMGDEGGGFDTDGGGSSLFGLTDLFFPSNSSGSAPSAQANSGFGGAYGFANARDIEFVRGKVLQALAARGVAIATKADSGSNGGKLYLLVSELGTAKEGFNMLVYREAKLSARAAMEAFFIPTAEVAGAPSAFHSLGSGECTTEYLARYLFGAGPLRGVQIKIMPGAIPATIEWPEGQSPVVPDAK